MEAFYLDQQPALEDSGRRMQASPLALRFMHRVHPPRSQGEIHPGHVIPVMARDRQGRNTIFPMQWGITIPPEPGKEAGSFLTLLRVENLARDSFRDLAEHRCIIPFSYYLETEPGQERRTGSGIFCRRLSPGGRTALLPDSHPGSRGTCCLSRCQYAAHAPLLCPALLDGPAESGPAFPG